MGKTKQKGSSTPGHVSVRGAGSGGGEQSRQGVGGGKVGQKGIKDTPQGRKRPPSGESQNIEPPMVGEFRDRNVAVIEVRVGDLVEHPANFRVHSDAQKKTLGQIVEEVGMYDTPTVFHNAKGQLQLIDGHMRREWLIEHHGEDAIIPVCLTDLSPEEALVALVTHDALGDMAGNDPDPVSRLIADAGDVGQGVQTLLDELGRLTGLDEDDGPKPVENPPKHDHTCPHCRHEWSGPPRPKMNRRGGA